MLAHPPSLSAAATLLLSLLLLPAATATSTQGVAFAASQTAPGANATPWTDASAQGQSQLQTKPYGRFLHITDLHPDTFYRHGSAVATGCHHKKPKSKKSKGNWRAGWWGTGVSDCDSPPRLVTSSLKWITDNFLPKTHGLRSEARASALDAQQQQNSSTAALGFDFIIWTGDSARHDIDDRLPRTLPEIFDLNRWTLKQIENAFPGVPIVPSMGNNDIFPHNILFSGPNPITKEFVRIWSEHIPEYEFHTFEQGGYYVKELLPNRLAAMSLNTLYFYDSNKAVEGCAKTKKRHGEREIDPGTAQLDWLEVQLDLLRQRKMQAHIIGHVPPTAGNYFPRCYKRYTDIVLRYQDTVVGQHFGHMNTDAFFIQEDQEALYAATEDAAALSESEQVMLAEDKLDVEEGEEEEDGEDIHVQGDAGLPGDLRLDFSSLPGKARTNEDYYSVFLVAPSIIPTYYPSIRVYTYNTSEADRYNGVFEDARRLAAEGASLDAADGANDEADGNDDDDDDKGEDDEEEGRLSLLGSFETASRHHHRPIPDKDRKKKHKKKHGGKKKRKTRHASPNSPSRTNTYLSLLGYSQWVMDIDAQNEHVERILDGTANATEALKRGEEVKKDNKGHKGKADKEERKRRQHEAERVEVEFRLEYATYEPHVLWQEFVAPRRGGGGEPGPGGPVPVPKPLLQAELDRLGVAPATLQADFAMQTAAEEQTKGEVDAEKKRRRHDKWRPPKAIRKLTDYSLPHLTVDTMLDLARRLVVDKKLWKRFVKRIYSESGYPKKRK
ncbi:Endopolyphosphatase [Thecaphora frezii]